jgi:dTDP-4-amino-4,6-dideoxygalactose transaminase
MTSRAFRVVEMFEEAVGDFAGARYGVATDSCSTALLLSCMYRGVAEVDVPRHTYISVPNAVIRAGGAVRWTDAAWQGAYRLDPYDITDSALRFRRAMFTGGLYCVSFHMRKHVKIGRGGMVLTDDPKAADWMRRMRFDGRDGSVPFPQDRVALRGFNAYMLPEQAARGLQLLEALPPDAPDILNDYPDLSVLPAFQEEAVS